MKSALLMAATDPTTGLVDMDLITTGTSAAARAAAAEQAKQDEKAASKASLQDD